MSPFESKKEIDNLITVCENLCHKLGEMAADDKKFCIDLCMGLDMISWDAWKMANDIKHIFERYGV